MLKQLVSIPIVACAALINLSCTDGRDVKLGQTSENELTTNRGAPTQTVSGVGKTNDTKLLFYSNAESFQIENDIVRGRNRRPSGPEVNIDHWRTKWAGLEKVYQAHDEGHNEILEILEPKSGVSVFYNPRSSKVERISEFSHE